VKDATSKAERAGIRLGRLLAQLHDHKYYLECGCDSEEDYIHKVFPQSRAQYYKLLTIGSALASYPVHQLEEYGISKCQDLVRIQRHSGGVIPENWFLHAKADDRDTFRRRVREHVTGKALPAGPEEEYQVIHFKIHGDDIMIINEALRIAALESGSAKSDGYNLKNICADFLAGHNEEGARLKNRDGMNLLIISRCTENLTFGSPTCADRLISTVAAAVERAKER